MIWSMQWFLDIAQITELLDNPQKYFIRLSQRRTWRLRHLHLPLCIALVSSPSVFGLLVVIGCPMREQRIVSDGSSADFSVHHGFCRSLALHDSLSTSALKMTMSKQTQKVQGDKKSYSRIPSRIVSPPRCSRAAAFSPFP